MDYSKYFKNLEAQYEFALLVLPYESYQQLLLLELPVSHGFSEAEADEHYERIRLKIGDGDIVDRLKMVIYNKIIYEK